MSTTRTISPLYGMVTPVAVPLEEVTIGTILVDTDAMLTVSTYLHPADFHDPGRQAIYSAALTLFENMIPIDIINIVEQLKKNNTLEQAGGISELVRLQNMVASAAHLESHVRTLKEYGIRRHLHQALPLMARKAIDMTADIFDTLEETLKELEEIETDVARSATPSIATQLKSAKEKSLSPQPTLQLTDIGALEELWDGGAPGDLIIIAARPGMGKSMLANAITKRQMRTGKKLTFFSLEMPYYQVLSRLIATESGISEKMIRLHRGQLSRDELIKVEQAEEKIRDSGILIDDGMGKTARDIRTAVQARHRREGLDAVIIDHGKLLKHMNPKGNSTEEIGNTCMLLKRTAKELDIPFIVLWQLSREVEKRSKPIPTLSDLRQSGEIEEAADKVLFIYRPEMYWDSDETTMKVDGRQMTRDEVEGLTHFILAKYRGGTIGQCRAKFDGRTASFWDWDMYGDLNDTPF